MSSRYAGEYTATLRNTCSTSALIEVEEDFGVIEVAMSAAVTAYAYVEKCVSAGCYCQMHQNHCNTRENVAECLVRRDHPMREAVRNITLVEPRLLREQSELYAISKIQRRAAREPLFLYPALLPRSCPMLDSITLAI
jgi:hypothetical protein